MENVGRAFSELLSIVSGVAIAFYSAVHNGRESTRLDIYATFSGPLDNFRSRVERCSRALWALKYDDEDHFGLIRRWLAPQDSILAFLASNRISLATRPEEYTCTWFQSHLNYFFKNNEKILAVEGKSGSGKTTLANWVVNRLQRPVFGRELSTLSFLYGANSSTP